MIRVLVVDDSATARAALRRAIEQDNTDLRVVAAVADSPQALRAIEQLRPDLVTMDVVLAHEDGVALTARIMAELPVPIVLVTGVNPHDAGLAFRATAAGALDVLPKLPAPSSPQYAGEVRRLQRVLRALAHVPLVTRHRQRPATPPAATSQTLPVAPHLPGGRTSGLVMIGASTGGPPALQEILRGLPPPWPQPIMLVQHIVEGFGLGLASWLRDTTGHDVSVCDQPRAWREARVLLAPDNQHLGFSSADAIAPLRGEPRHFQRPSVDVLFESAVQVGLAPVATALLLTGMGSDGARGLRALRDHGARTWAQAPASCVVDGMPSAAIALGAVEAVHDLAGMVSALRGVGA